MSDSLQNQFFSGVDGLTVAPAESMNLNRRSGAILTLLAFLAAVFTMPLSRGESLRIVVLDLLAGTPIPGAAVTIRQRLVTTTAEGENRLHPIEAGRLLQILEADNQGAVSADVTASGHSFYAVEVSAPGFSGQIESMLHIEAGGAKHHIFRLVPDPLTPAQAEAVARIQEALRPREPLDQGPYLPLAEVQAAALTVPDEVRVQNLNGFTGMMNFDEFIGGVVTREMNDGFPREALRAQAVASRSFALHRLRTLGYANGGQAYNPTLGSLSRAAALHTTKQVLLYNGSVAQAFFSARCNGDFTLNSEHGPTLSRCFPGGLTTVVVPYCRSRPCSGHINCSETVEQCCSVTINNKVNYIYGHGVGLCQRGAQQFAQRDQLDYVTILHRFYTSVTLFNGAALPEVETVGIDIVDAQTVRIKGRVLHDGGAVIDDRRFDWGSVPSALDKAVFKEHITVNGQAFEATLSGLQLGATYYFRAWAHNASTANGGAGAGWALGEILSFKLEQADPPVISPAGGLFANSLTVRLSTDITGGAIHYTLDGTAPSLSSARYAAPIEISGPVSVRAQSYKAGVVPSELATATFSVHPQNELSLKIIEEQPQFILEVRSTEPHTLFQIETSPSLEALTWPKLFEGNYLQTGADNTFRISPAPPSPNPIYFRAVIP